MIGIETVNFIDIACVGLIVVELLYAFSVQSSLKRCHRQ